MVKDLATAGVRDDPVQYDWQAGFKVRDYVGVVQCSISIRLQLGNGFSETGRNPFPALSNGQSICAL